MAEEFHPTNSNGKQVYVPPEQGAGGQIFDTIFLLVIIYCVLLLPLLFGITAGETVTNKPDPINWETLGQNKVMQAQWERLGMSPEEAAEYICTRFVYKIQAGSLAFTALVIIGYFVIVIRFAGIEYRDVINEKFQ